MAQLLYKPLGLIFSVLGSILAGAIFKRVWTSVSQDEEPPKATDERRGWSEVVAAAAIQGAVAGGVKALMHRGGATGFARLTGTWPGESKS
jgi:uncharacterized protein DUF4235